jgi:hypothetical protein
VSFVIGAYVWSSSSFGGGSKVITGDTIVSRLSAVVDNVRVNNGAEASIYSASCIGTI